MVDKIRELCKKNGLSVTDLETRCKFARGYIYKLNNSSPTIENAKKIADVLGCKIDDLICK